jgi:ABC-type lipoprotein export system ATPase subunit
VTAPVLELSAVVKDYRGLRPLRIERLSLARGDCTAILGLDRGAAETLVNLITGATLPDTGEVLLFGRATATIQDSREWLALVDRFGIVTDRAVLLDALSVVQNLSLPFTLEIEPPPTDVRDRAAALAIEVGLRREDLERRMADLSPTARFRIRLGRALALDPAILLLEHPTADVDREDVGELARELSRIGERRNAAVLILTSDVDFARTAARTVARVELASGRLVDGGSSGWWRRRRSL